MSAQELITDHLDLWTGAVTKKSSSGRGSNGKVELTGVKKLRDLILELAVRGKLVEQDPTDEPTEELLLKVYKDNEAASKKKKTSEFTMDDAPRPYSAPRSWAWAHLGDLFDIVYGKGLPKSKLTDEGYEVFGANGIIGKYTEYTYEHPQLLISCRGAYSGKANISPAQCFITSNTLILRNSWSYLTLQYFYYALTVADKSKIVTGSAQPQVTTANLSPFLVAVPPLKEQHRIVQKVDELMALCDRLEQQTSDQLEAHETLVDTLLGTLTQSENATELADNWARLAAHFDTLFTTEQSIDKLKQTILQLAVMGRLVEQDAGDESAEQLIERIAAHMAETGNGKRRVSKPSKSGRSESQPFQVPSTWAWVSLRQVGLTSTGKTPSTKTASFFSGDIPFIGPGQVTVAGKINSPEKHLSEEGIHQSEEALPGDILTVCIGGSIGKTAIVTERCGFNQQLNKIRPVLAEPGYLLAAINADFFQHSIREKATGSATPIINRSKWESISIPLAPLAEQHRIVQKVDELIALCDHLKERLDQASQTRCQLAEAVAEGALS